MTLNIRTTKTDAAANTLEIHNKRISSWYDMNITLGYITAAPNLEICYPLAYNKVTAKYAPWMAPAPTVLVVTLTEAASGTWTITVNGVTTANIVYAPTAAAVAAALRAIGYLVTVVKAAAVYTITFDNDKELETFPTVSGTVSGISGGSPTAEATAGTSSNGTHKIVGFVHPNDIQSHATEDVVGIMMVSGEVHYDDVVALVASADITALQTALKDGLASSGLMIQGLPGVH